MRAIKIKRREPDRRDKRKTSQLTHPELLNVTSLAASIEDSVFGRKRRWRTSAASCSPYAHLKYKKLALPLGIRSSASSPDYSVSLTALPCSPNTSLSQKTADIGSLDNPKPVTMVPYPALNASATPPLNLSPYRPSQPSVSQFGGFNQNQWSPDAIGTIIFGVIMFLIGITALWQGRPRRTMHARGTPGSFYSFESADSEALDEEQGFKAPIEHWPADIPCEVPTADHSEESGSERVAVGMDEQAHEDDMVERELVKIERGMRTDTEGTLVGHNDDGREMKELEG